MELKTYQQSVLQDLVRFLDLMTDKNSYMEAYRNLWEEKGFSVGFGGMKPYQDLLPGVPHVCFKVPTGGGKTFQACCSIKPIFDALPAEKVKAVVWLVPSESILAQTLEALRSPEHPYRQKLDVQFGGRVEVYTKEQLLSGQNFNISTVTEQLSVMVLSYDSFRGRKESLKSKQENSALAPMAKALGAPQSPIDGADETALIQVINQLNPLVIVDESHHARSTLSLSMLEDFNPCFVLDLTATPTEKSNIISYVDAYQLKRENMVKLPVIVYNRDSIEEVIADAKDMRDRLEAEAKEAEAQGGAYIRPIVLFQAQPKTGADSETFEKVRQKLVACGIPAEQIAIKTADINELKNVSLMSCACPIRYIITVNALKEGWDCPFAYILASLANKTSKIDVEQIVGRILRQPYTRKHTSAWLNLSYVLTCSNDFSATLEGIVSGLNSAGFSKKDYRVAEATAPDVLAPVPAPRPAPLPPQQPEPAGGTDIPAVNLIGGESGQGDENGTDDVLNVNPEHVKGAEGKPSHVDSMLNQATQQGEAFNDEIKKNDDDSGVHTPVDLQHMKNTFAMNPEFAEEVSALVLPQFVRKIQHSLFLSDDVASETPLTMEQLTEGFTLKGKPTAINWQGADSEMVQIDVRQNSSGEPKVMKMGMNDQKLVKEYLNTLAPERKIHACKDIIHGYLNRMDAVDSADLSRYIDRIIEEMDEAQLSALERSPMGFAQRIKDYVQALLNTHVRERFKTLLDQSSIVCRPLYRFPRTISPASHTSLYGGSLYEAEESGNNFEMKLVRELAQMENIKWWHRNISRTGFCLNGFINHYPDFIVCTTGGNIVVIETKGEHLGNADSKDKLELGRKWADKAGEKYNYFMVYDTNAPEPGAYTFNKFIEILSGM